MFVNCPLSRLFAGPLRTFHVGMDPGLKRPAHVRIWGLPMLTHKLYTEPPEKKKKNSFIYVLTW